MHRSLVRSDGPHVPPERPYRQPDPLPEREHHTNGLTPSRSLSMATPPNSPFGTLRLPHTGHTLAIATCSIARTKDSGISITPRK